MAKGTQLAYYEKDSSHQPKGIVPLEAISNLKKIKQREFEFLFEKRTFSLKCGSENDRDLWFRNIEWLIEYNEKQKAIQEEQETNNRRIKRAITETGKSEKLGGDNKLTGVMTGVLNALTFQKKKDDSKWKNIDKDLLN